MKKFYLSVAFAAACFFSQAQYKKASFLNKDGRTQEVGASGHFVSDTKSTFPGIIYSYGRDKGTRAFHWFDLELTLPSTFSYETYETGSPEKKVSVAGKTGVGIFYRYNFAYYLGNITDEAVKFKPFITAGINIALLSVKVKDQATTPPDVVALNRETVSDGFNYGGNIGLGAVYEITAKTGVKLTAGYNYQDVFDPSVYDGVNEKFIPFGSHPYVTLGVRFKIVKD